MCRLVRTSNACSRYINRFCTIADVFDEAHVATGTISDALGDCEYARAVTFLHGMALSPSRASSLAHHALIGSDPWVTFHAQFLGTTTSITDRSTLALEKHFGYIFRDFVARKALVCFRDG